MPRTHQIRNASPVLSAALERVFPKGVATDETGEPLKAVGWRAWKRVQLAAARLLFGRQFGNGKELEAFLESGSKADSSLKFHMLNEVMLPLHGVGPDSFWINEILDDDGMRGFETLREYDEGKWNHHQQAMRREGLAEGDIPPYRASMLRECVRWLDKGGLVYGEMSTAAVELAAETKEAAGEWARLLYPFDVEMVEKKGGTRMKAVPKSAARKYYKARRWAEEEIGRRSERWYAHFEDLQPAVAYDWKFEYSDRECRLTFFNAETLGSVRPRSFLADLDALRDGTAEFRAYVDAEVAGFREWLMQALPMPEPEKAP